MMPCKLQRKKDVLHVASEVSQPVARPSQKSCQVKCKLASHLTLHQGKHIKCVKPEDEPLQEQICNMKQECSDQPDVAGLKAKGHGTKGVKVKQPRKRRIVMKDATNCKKTASYPEDTLCKSNVESRCWIQRTNACKNEDERLSESHTLVNGKDYRIKELVIKLEPLDYVANSVVLHQKCCQKKRQEAKKNLQTKTLKAADGLVITSSASQNETKFVKVNKVISPGIITQSTDAEKTEEADKNKVSVNQSEDEASNSKSCCIGDYLADIMPEEDFEPDYDEEPSIQESAEQNLEAGSPPNHSQEIKSPDNDDDESLSESSISVPPKICKKTKDVSELQPNNPSENIEETSLENPSHSDALSGIGRTSVPPTEDIRVSLKTDKTGATKKHFENSQKPDTSGQENMNGVATVSTESRNEKKLLPENISNKDALSRVKKTDMKSVCKPERTCTVKVPDWFNEVVNENLFCLKKEDDVQDHVQDGTLKECSKASSESNSTKFINSKMDRTDNTNDKPLVKMVATDSVQDRRSSSTAAVSSAKRLGPRQLQLIAKARKCNGNIKVTKEKLLTQPKKEPVDTLLRECSIPAESLGTSNVCCPPDDSRNNKEKTAVKILPKKPSDGSTEYTSKETSSVEKGADNVQIKCECTTLTPVDQTIVQQHKAALPKNDVSEGCCQRQVCEDQVKDAEQFQKGLTDSEPVQSGQLDIFVVNELEDGDEILDDEMQDAKDLPQASTNKGLLLSDAVITDCNIQSTGVSPEEPDNGLSVDKFNCSASVMHPIKTDCINFPNASTHHFHQSYRHNFSNNKQERIVLKRNQSLTSSQHPNTNVQRKIHQISSGFCGTERNEMASHHESFDPGYLDDESQQQLYSDDRKTSSLVPFTQIQAASNNTTLLNDNTRNINLMAKPMNSQTPELFDKREDSDVAGWKDPNCSPFNHQSNGQETGFILKDSSQFRKPFSLESSQFKPGCSRLVNDGSPCDNACFDSTKQLNREQKHFYPGTQNGNEKATCGQHSPAEPVPQWNRSNKYQTQRSHSVMQNCDVHCSGGLPDEVGQSAVKHNSTSLSFYNLMKEPTNGFHKENSSKHQLSEGMTQRNTVLLPSHLECEQNAVIPELRHTIQMSGREGRWDRLAKILAQLISMNGKNEVQQYLQHFANALMNGSKYEMNFMKFLQEISVFEVEYNCYIGTIGLMLIVNCWAQKNFQPAFLILFLLHEKNISYLYPSLPFIVPPARIILTVTEICLVVGKPELILHTMQMASWFEKNTMTLDLKMTVYVRVDAIRDLLVRLVNATKLNQIIHDCYEDILSIIATCVKKLAVRYKTDQFIYPHYSKYLDFNLLFKELVPLAKTHQHKALYRAIIKTISNNRSICLHPKDIRDMLHFFYYTSRTDPNYYEDAFMTIRYGSTLDIYPHTKYCGKTGGIVVLWQLMSREEMHVAMDCYLDNVCVKWLNLGIAKAQTGLRLSVQLSDLRLSPKIKQAYSHELSMKVARKDAIDKAIAVFSKDMKPPLEWTEYSNGIFKMSAESLFNVLQNRLLKKCSEDRLKVTPEGFTDIGITRTKKQFMKKRELISQLWQSVSIGANEKAASRKSPFGQLETLPHSTTTSWLNDAKLPQDENLIRECNSATSIEPSVQKTSDGNNQSLSMRMKHIFELFSVTENRALNNNMVRHPSQDDAEEQADAVTEHPESGYVQYPIEPNCSKNISIDSGYNTTLCGSSVEKWNQDGSSRCEDLNSTESAEKRYGCSEYSRSSWYDNCSPCYSNEEGKFGQPSDYEKNQRPEPSFSSSGNTCPPDPFKYNYTDQGYMTESRDTPAVNRPDMLTGSRYSQPQDRTFNVASPQADFHQGFMSVCDLDYNDCPSTLGPPHQNPYVNRYQTSADAALPVTSDKRTVDYGSYSRQRHFEPNLNTNAFTERRFSHKQRQF